MDIGATVRVFRAEPLAAPGDPAPDGPPTDGAATPAVPVPDGMPPRAPDRAGEPVCAAR
ncbi:hypothetical protein WHI96_11750 [Pseudonocardia tropica]|uniref:Uncharacterized protein n=1 Tax=Pseudonocardia tropica TaxID=681289 RepID=A0ABV1JU65_9PSEU